MSPPRILCEVTINGMEISITELYSRSPDRRLFSIDFFGKPVTTTVASTASVARKWIRYVLPLRRRHLNRLVVGVGVQWPPNYVPGEDQPAATLQPASAGGASSSKSFRSETPPSVPLESAQQFVGIWNHSVAKKLLNSKLKLEMCKPVDLRYYVESKNSERFAQESTETIVREYLDIEGVRLGRWIKKSDWDACDLSDLQVVQACVEMLMFRLRSGRS